MKAPKLKPLVWAIGFAVQALAQHAFSEEVKPIEEVLVTGFRAAQAAALETKRNSANNVESIVAEDIGKMPDLNLAESLQRLPGVSITREGGEGRQITVRGLGPEYSRVTMNGMEVPSSTGGTDSSGGTNRGRPFDFNVFGSELFSQIVINKSAVGHIEEGGFASTVELFSHSPLHNPGMTLNGSVQGAYNVNTGDASPRLSGIFANTFLDDKLGLLLAVNHADRDVRQDGFGTVRWTSPYQNGKRSFIEPMGGTVVNGEIAENIAPKNDPDNVRDANLNDLYYPRLPRMDAFNRETTRLGLVLGLEYQPIDDLKFGIKVLNSTLEQDTTSNNYFAQFRNTFNTITANQVNVDVSGKYITGGDFSNVKPRSESRVQNGESEFTQVVFDFEYHLSDTLRLTGLFGNANSTYREDYYRYNIDVDQTAIEAAGGNLDFSFNLTDNQNLANMSYGFDINDYSLGIWTDARIQKDDLERDYSTYKLDLVWDFDDQGSNIMGGIIYNNRNIKSDYYRTDVKNADLKTPVSLTDSNSTTIDQVYGNFGDGIDAPSGFPVSWLVANFSNLYSDIGSPVAAFFPTDSNTYDVTEETLGLYTEANWIYGKFLANGGLRYVETTVTSGGYTQAGANVIYSELSDSYDNLLPSVNLTYNITDSVKARAAWSKNISRPNPASLSGSVSVAPIGGTVNANNPALKPELAKSLDLSVEWYIDDDSYVGLTVFQKDITDAISSENLPKGVLPADIRAIVAQQPEYQVNPIDASTTPLDSDQWAITTKTNAGAPTNIDGWELAYQQVFGYGIGVLGNYTKVLSNQDIDGLSETSINLGVFWEIDEFGIRLVMNERDDYTTSSPGSDGNAQEKTTGPTRFDVSSFWHINNHFTATFEVINLTDEKERLYTTGLDGDLNLVREYNTTGTEIMFGIRASF